MTKKKQTEWFWAGLFIGLALLIAVNALVNITGSIKMQILLSDEIEEAVEDVRPAFGGQIIDQKIETLHFFQIIPDHDRTITTLVMVSEREFEAYSIGEVWRRKVRETPEVPEVLFNQSEIIK